MQVRVIHVIICIVMHVKMLMKSWMDSVMIGQSCTSDIQAIITGKLCKRGHIVGVVGKVMSLLCNALCSLQDAIIAGSLK